MQLTAKNENGQFRKRADHILKSELTATFIEKAREHVKAKATETQQLQHAATERARVMQLKKETARSSTHVAAECTATEHATAEFCLESAAVENSPQLLQSTATSSTAGSMLEQNQLLQSIGARADPITNNYANLFE